MSCGNNVSGSAKKMDFLDVLLELPVINKGLFPFRNKLTLKLFRELHHLSLYLAFPERGQMKVERACGCFNGSP